MNDCDFGKVLEFSIRTNEFNKSAVLALRVLNLVLSSAIASEVLKDTEPFFQ